MPLYGDARNERLNIQLNGFRRIESKEDWLNGFEYALNLGKERLGLSDDVVFRARTFGLKFHHYLSGIPLSRVVLAGACIYISCVLNGDKRTQYDVAQSLGITETSLRERYQQVLDIERIDDEIKIHVANMTPKEKREMIMQRLKMLVDNDDKLMNFL